MSGDFIFSISMIHPHRIFCEIPKFVLIDPRPYIVHQRFWGWISSCVFKMVVLLEGLPQLNCHNFLAGMTGLGSHLIIISNSPSLPVTVREDINSNLSPNPNPNLCIFSFVLRRVWACCLPLFHLTCTQLNLKD